MRKVIGLLVLLVASSQCFAASATSPALPPPTRVTLHLDHASPRTAFEKLFQQAHLSVDELDPHQLELSASHSISVNLVNEPFLSALMELCRQGAMEPSINSMNMTGLSFRSRMVSYAGPSPEQTSHNWAMRRPASMPAIPRPLTTTRSSPAPSWVDYPGVVQGPFMFVLRDVELRSYQNMGSRPYQYCYVTIVGMVEPSAQIYAAGITLAVDVAEDDHGRSLLPLKPTFGRTEPKNRGVWYWTISANVDHPASDATRIAKLSGRVNVSIVTRAERLTLNDLKSPATTQTSDAIRLKSETIQGDERSGFFLPVTLSRDNRTDQEWEELVRLVSDNRNVQVEDSSANRISCDLQRERSTDEQSQHLALTVSPAFRNGKRLAVRPARVTWTIPLEVADAAIPVEFHDLPLP